MSFSSLAGQLAESWLPERITREHSFSDENEHFYIEMAEIALSYPHRMWLRRTDPLISLRQKQKSACSAVNHKHRHITAKRAQAREPTILKKNESTHDS